MLFEKTFLFIEYPKENNSNNEDVLDVRYKDVFQFINKQIS